MGVLDQKRQITRGEIIRLAVGGFYLGGVWGSSATARGLSSLTFFGLWLWDWSSR